MTPSSPMSKGNWFTNRPIRHQVAGFLLIYALIICVLVAVVRQSAVTPQTSIAALSRASRIADLADNLTIALLDAQASFALYMTTGAPTYRDQLVTQQSEYRSLIEAIRGAEPSAAASERLQRLDELTVTLRREMIEPGLALRQAVNDGTATIDDVARFLSAESHRETLRQIRLTLNAFATDERRLAAEQGASISALVESLQWIYLIGAGVLLIFGILVAYHIDSDIAAPLQRMIRLAREIADGRLDRRIGWTRQDELGQMATTFDEVVARLETLIRAQETSLRDVQQKEAVQAAMLNGSVEGLVLISPDHRIMTVNNRLSDLAGVDLTRFRDQDVRSLIPLAQSVLVDPERIIREAVALVQAGDDEAAIHLRQHFPVSRELQGYATPVRGRDGENLGHLVAVRDVTRERQSDRMKSEFVSMVSHELRTPLTSIKGYVDLLRDGELGELTDDQLGFLNIVANSTDRLVALINDLLDLSHIESGKLVLRLEPLDVATRIHDVVAALRPRLDAKRHQLSVEEPAAPLLILGDPDRVDQMLANLLSNAIKYTPDGGVIAITVTREDGSVCVRIADSGIGIAEADQDQLFTRFFRSDNPVVRQAGGTGLGLAITRSLVELHGGEISLQSRLGAGSTFTIAFPQAAAGDGADWTAGLGGENGRILLILDAPDVAGQFAAVFRRTGHAVQVATTAADGLRLARATQPSVVLVSDQLPDAEGLGVVRRLRDDPDLGEPALILISYARASGAPTAAGDTATPAAAPIVEDRVLKVLTLDGRFTVLLGGDNVQARRLAADLYRRDGHRVIETDGGVAAVEATLSNAVDVALVETKVSDADQFELLRSLRTSARAQHVPLIAMITEADAAHASRLLVETLSILVLKKQLTLDEIAGLIDPALSHSTVS